MSDHLLSHSNSFGFEMEIDTAGCRAYNRNYIVGDVIDTTIVSDAGSVDIQVENSAGDSIYSETDVPTSEFEIPISQDDTYTFTVTGHGAKGSVSFIKS